MRPNSSYYDRVLELLTVEEKYRNSDKRLFLRIVNDLGLLVYSDKNQRYYLDTELFLTGPDYESIRRSRQKVQREYPSLQATDPKVRKQRGQKEATKGTFIYREPFNPYLRRARV